MQVQRGEERGDTWHTSAVRGTARRKAAFSLSGYVCMLQRTLHGALRDEGPVFSHPRTGV